MSAAVGDAVKSALDVVVGDDEDARDAAKRLMNLEANKEGNHDPRGWTACGESAAGEGDAAFSVAKKLIFQE